LVPLYQTARRHSSVHS